VRGALSNERPYHDLRNPRASHVFVSVAIKRRAGDQQLLRAPSTTSRLTNIAVLELGEPEQRSKSRYSRSWISARTLGEIALA
jgi:hypothetical protein